MSLPQHHVAVETVVFDFYGNKPEVLLIKRGHKPYKNFWAIPGGFLEENEEVPEGAARELVEETGVSVDPDDLNLITVLSRTEENRTWKTIIVVYSTVIDKTEWNVRADDDAIGIGWYPVDDMPKLAADHQDIILKALGESYYDPR